jgi:nitrite reductase/ring-hydroxylating ferredoxin subunit
VVRLNQDEIIARLVPHGYRFRKVRCEVEGTFQIADVDWNNKDVPHLNEVHAWANDVTCVVEEDLQASISLQKVLGIPFPLALVHYDSAGGHQTHFITVLAWAIVTEHEFVAVSPTRTRAITTYAVGANRFWMLFFPLIRALIRRNYRKLMSEDVPMRERRGRLRSWGYTFRGDEKPARDIRDSLPVARNNVIPPANGDAPGFDPVAVAELTADGTLIGRSDHLGLRLCREGDAVVAYPRMCPHEGADLDGVTAVDRCVVCPWHARRIPPSAVLDLGAPDATATTRWHELELVDGHIVITSRAADRNARVSTD